MSDSNPKVSVCVVAYNHEKYISECLQSLVSQETNFSFEIIVGDDCSTDGTKSIIKDYESNYPGLVRPIYQAKNVGAADNYYIVHSAARGEYIAHLDGDDYALPGKLQTQADYLDANPRCNIVWHRMRFKYEESEELIDDLIDVKKLPPNGFTRNDLLRFLTPGAHSSKMYRSHLRNFDKPDFPIVDFYVNVIQVGEGYACLLGGPPLGVYRAGIGIASANSKTKIVTCENLHYLSRIYKDGKSAVSAAALVKSAAAAKNFRWVEFYAYIRLTINTLSLTTFFEIWRNRHIYKILRLPKKPIRAPRTH